MKHYLQDFDAFALPRHIRTDVVPEIAMPIVNQLAAKQYTPRIVHALEPVVEFQSARAGRMHLFQLSDPRFQRDVKRENCAYVFLDHKERGLVACAGVRRKRLHFSLGEHATDLSLYYDEPGMAAPCESGRVQGDAVRRIESCQIAFSVSLECDKGEASIAVPGLMKLLHLWALCHMEWSFLIGLAEDGVARRYTYDPHGFVAPERGIWRTRHGEAEQIEYKLLHASWRHYHEFATNPDFLRLEAKRAAPVEVPQ